MKPVIKFICIATLLSSCQEKKQVNTFQDDLDFLKQYTSIVILTSANDKGRIVVAPALQGRVMTSSTNGTDGMSLGWINRELFASRDTLLHMNAFGGEERFWLGPEGGQYGIFFKPGSAFTFDDWQTPPLIDIEPFQIMSQSSDSVVFMREASIVNYQGFEFKIRITRKIQIMPVEAELGLTEVKYQTINTLTNIGGQPWKKETGLLSIWLLGMFNPTSETTVIIPFVEGNEAQMGPIVIDDYFDKVPSNRLKIENGVCYFTADGKYRSKIGLNPKRAKNILGAYDRINKILTVVSYSKADSITDYVNSKWEIQQSPYQGDAINSYNDGPPSPGAKPMGPFYELETSSPAIELKPGESITHRQTTRHIQGDDSSLSYVCRRYLGVSLPVHSLQP
jgi:hypothetical protein